MTKNKLFKTAVIITLSTYIITGCGKYQIVRTDEATVQEEETLTESIENKESTKVEETTETVDDGEIHTNMDIPDAKHFDIMEWPTFGIVTELPKPMWSDRGSIYINSEMQYWCTLGYTTLDDFDNYIQQCKDLGFNIDYYEDYGYLYFAKNADGRYVYLVYNQWAHSMGIEIGMNGDEFDKWWAEE